MPRTECVTWTQREAARIRIALARKWGEAVPERLLHIAEAAISNPRPVSWDQQRRPYRVLPPEGARPEEPSTYVSWTQREAARIHIALAEKWGETVPERLHRVAGAARELAPDAAFAGTSSAAEPQGEGRQKSDS